MQILSIKAAGKMRGLNCDVSSQNVDMNQVSLCDLKKRKQYTLLAVAVGSTICTKFRLQQDVKTNICESAVFQGCRQLRHLETRH
jgi:hypothetical protein